MKKCLLCEQYFIPEISFWSLLMPKKVNLERICKHCARKFSKLSGKLCLYCQKNLKQGKICSDCLRWQKQYQGKILRHHAVYHYNEAFHEIMIDYKRYGDYFLAQVLAELINQQLPSAEFDYYIPIPTSPEHQEKRQFDTVTAIFKNLLPLSHFLQKRKGSGAQGEKNRKERLAAPQDFFIAKTNLPQDNRYKAKMLLLDDIYTTGRTLYNARDKLWEAFPNAEIESFSICR